MSDKTHPDNITLARQIAAFTPEKRALLKRRMQSKQMNGHLLLARSLIKLGITHIFGLSGTPVIKTMAACAAEGLRTIGVRHQQAAVLMAVAQNYTAGRMTAVAICSAGPAITNAVTGVLVAKDNCWPIIVLGGRRTLRKDGIGEFQELDGVALFRSITKWAALVDSTDSIADYLFKAFKIAVTGQPGPVYLDIQEDVLSGHCNNTTLHEYLSQPGQMFDPDAVNQAAELLLAAERPGLIIGKGLRWCEPFELLRNLVDTYHLPFISSPMGRGSLPDDHPLCFNHARSLLQSQADTLLILGARLDWTFRYGNEFAADVKLIHIDIEAAELGRNRAVAVGIAGDAKQFLFTLLTQLRKKAVHQDRKVILNPWLNCLGRQRDKALNKLATLCQESAIPMSPHRMAWEICNAIPADTICLLDGNVSMAAVQQVLPANFPVSRFTAGSNGCMGVGIPFAMGVKLACPERPVLVISGDTAFGFNCMELETAVRYKLPLIVIVANNEGISGALTHNKYYPIDYPERVTQFQPNVHYESICEAFGGYAATVESPEHLKPILQQAIQSGLPACINVRVDSHAPYPGAL